MLHTSAHYTLDEAEAEAIWFIGTLATIKASGEQTGGVLGVTEFTVPPGFATPEHVHHTADEAFYILAGRLRGYCGDQTWQATTGSFVWLPRDVPHGYTVEGDEPARVLTITVPAGFERFVVAAGEPAQARELPPPPERIDVERFDAEAAKVGITHLGPPRP